MSYGHKENAEELMGFGDDSGKPTSYQFEGLIRATLYAADQTAALAEQQRIANLIALAEAPGGWASVYATADYDDVHAVIRKGLGL